MIDQLLTLYVHPDWLLNSNQRPHWAKKARMTRNLRGLAHAEAKRQGIRPVAVRQRVTVTFGFLTNSRHRDPGNWSGTSKALLDGITDCGVWPDDNSVWVEGPDHREGALSTDVHTQKVRKLRRVQVTILLQDAAGPSWLA